MTKCLGVMGHRISNGGAKAIPVPGWLVPCLKVTYTPWGQPHPAEVWQEWGPLFGTLRTGPLLTLVDLGLACVNEGHVTLPPLPFLLCGSSGRCGPHRSETLPSPLFPASRPMASAPAGAFGGGDREVHTRADKQAGATEEEPVLNKTQFSLPQSTWAQRAALHTKAGLSGPPQALLGWKMTWKMGRASSLL